VRTVLISDLHLGTPGCPALAQLDSLRRLLRKARKGACVIFVPGNHDEFARNDVAHNFGGVTGRAGGARAHGRPTPGAHATTPSAWVSA
jgi:metallophosphoesterase superfamily enzyme